MGTVHLGEVHMDLRAAPRSDGYRPITEMLWVWPTFVGPPADEAWRYILSLARRLDTAHRQLERLREAVDQANKLLQGATGSSPGSREAAFAAIGEAELFVVGLYRALRMAGDIPAHFGTQAESPGQLTSQLPHVKETRDAFEHIDERAFELRRRSHDPAALTVFEFHGFLFQERTLRYHQSALQIDEEATDLIIATRDFVVRAWIELCDRRQVEPDPSSSMPTPKDI